MAQSNKPLPVDEPEVVESEPLRKLARIHYEDGTFEDINPNRPRLLTAFAAAHQGKAEPDTIEESMWLMWQAAGRPVVDGAGTSDKDRLAAWIDTIEEIQDVYVERSGKARR